MKRSFAKLTELTISNKGLKFLSLIIAIICWYGIQGTINSDNTIYSPTLDNDESEQDQTVSLPVNVLTSPSETEPSIEVKPEKVEVKLQFAQGRPAVSRSNGISAFVDCSAISKSGKYTLPVRCIPPLESRIIDISPSNVIVDIEFGGKQSKSDLKTGSR